MNVSSCVFVLCQSGMRRIQLVQFRWRDFIGSGEVVRGRDSEGGSFYWVGRFFSFMVYLDCMDGGLDIVIFIFQVFFRGLEVLVGLGVYFEFVGCFRCSLVTVRKFLYFSFRLLVQRMYFFFNVVCLNLLKFLGILFGCNFILKVQYFLYQ